MISEKEQPPAGYSLLSRTADTDQKAWRKRQITYKLAKRGTITQAVTDIILCSKIRQAPAGFELAGYVVPSGCLHRTQCNCLTQLDRSAAKSTASRCATSWASAPTGRRRRCQKCQSPAQPKRRPTLRTPLRVPCIT